MDKDRKQEMEDMLDDLQKQTAKQIFEDIEKVGSWKGMLELKKKWCK